MGDEMAHHMKLKTTLAALGATFLLSACGGGGGGGSTLDGVYYPQFDPDANRLDRALTDQSWSFSADGSVVTTSEGGDRQWTYKVKGKKVRRLD